MFKMGNDIKRWLDAEMQDFAKDLKAYNKGTMKKLPLWMALCVIGMVTLGFVVGAGLSTVLTLHLPIGLGLAAFVGLCFWLQGRSVSVKKARASYEKALSALPPQDQAAFAAQAPQCGQASFANRLTDKNPARLTIGPEYWLYFRDLGCQVYRVADMQRLGARQETTRVGYSLGETRVRQNLGTGVSLVVGYRDGTASAGKSPEATLYLDNAKQLEEAYALIHRHCPKGQALLGGR